MFWVLPDWLCFYVGLAATLITLLKFVSRFIRRPYHLYERYGGGWAVVTGGSDGIGLGFCEQLTKLGFNICIVSRNKHKIHKVLNRLKQINGKIQTRTVVADFTNSLQAGFYDNIMKQIEDLDVSILVNNVGVLNEIGPYHQYKHEEIYKQCTVNMIPAAMMTRHLLPKMISRQKHSAIIFLSSYSTLMRLKHSVSYCATKLFNDFLSRSLSHEHHDKVDFLSLKPGLVTTEMSRNTSSLAHVNKNQCARGALRSLGKYQVYAGSWWHEALNFATELMPEVVRDVLIGKSWGKIGDHYKEIDNKKHEHKSN